MISHLVLALSLMFQAEQPKTPPASKAAPELSAVEAVAIHSIRMQMLQLQQQAAGVDHDLRMSHPGYHVNFNTEQLEIDQQPPEPPVSRKPEMK